MDWEILEIEVLTTWQTRTEIEHKHEKYMRVRVILQDRLGESITVAGDIDIDRELKRAMHEALTGPRINFNFCSDTTVSNRTWDEWDFFQKEGDFQRQMYYKPYLVGFNQKKIKFRLKTRNDAYIEDGMIQEKFQFGINTDKTIYLMGLEDKVGEYNVWGKLIQKFMDNSPLFLCQENLWKSSWLLSPYVLSTLYLNDLLKILTTECNTIPEIPSNLLVMDRGKGLKFDFEGTPRKRVTFIENGCLITQAHNFFSASLINVPSTGHAGLNGRTIWDLYVGPKEYKYDIYYINQWKKQWLDEEFLVITGVHPFSYSDTQACFISFLNPLYKNTGKNITIRAKIPSLWELCKIGEWVGPVQYGRHPWASPWMIVREPIHLFELV